MPRERSGGVGIWGSRLVKERGKDKMRKKSLGKEVQLWTGLVRDLGSRDGGCVVAEKAEWDILIGSTISTLWQVTEIDQCFQAGKRPPLGKAVNSLRKTELSGLSCKMNRPLSSWDGQAPGEQGWAVHSFLLWAAMQNPSFASSTLKSGTRILPDGLSSPPLAPASVGSNPQDLSSASQVDN